MGTHSRSVASEGPRPHPRPIRTKVKALLAGGLVLGIGASITMASWTDNEYAQGTFSTSTFNTESSVNSGTSWADNTPSPGATMTFAGTGMSPTQVRYAPLWVRTKTVSTAGTLALQSATNTNATLAAALTLRVKTYATGGTCDATLFTTATNFVVGTLSTPASLSTAGTGTQVVAANQGAVVQYCFEVAMISTAANTLQGQTLTATWQIIATSTP